MPRLVKFLVLPLVLVLAAGAGAAVYLWSHRETNHDVLLRHAGQLRAIGKDLRALAKVLPPTGSIKKSACPGLTEGQRPFRHYGFDPRPDNIAFVMQDRLTQPDRRPGKYEPIGSELTDDISAVEPGYRLDSWDERPADDTTDRHVTHLTRVRYVGVIRLADVSPPTLADPGSGWMTVEGVLADLHTHKILCTVTATAATASTVTYYYAEGADDQARQESAQAALESSLSTSGTVVLEKALKDLRRGTFSLR